MNTNAQFLSKQADLALAAYARSGASGISVEDLIDAGMSRPQALAFANEYRLLLPVHETPSSFDAYVFQDKAKNLTLAIRGTLELHDFVTDVDIALKGAAYDQIVAMYNWWVRVSSPIGSLVPQFKYVNELRTGPPPSNALVVFSDPEVITYVQPAPLAVASGVLASAIASDPDGKIDVTGHSLGAHLSLAFNALFPITVNQVTAFDTPGFLSSPLNQQFFSMLAGAMVPNFSNSGNVINVFADEANVGSTSFKAVAGLHSPPGPAVAMPIENQFASDEPNPPWGVFNHSQMILADSTSVFDVLTRLAPSLTVEQYKVILSQACLGTAASYERVVDAVEKLLAINNDPLPFGNANRDALYNAIFQIEATINERGLSGNLSLLRTDASNLIGASLEASGVGYRFALKTLAPFIPIGPSSLYEPINQNGQLDLFNPTTGFGDLTESWIADRAAMLGWLMKYNIADGNIKLKSNRIETYLFQNKTSATEVDEVVRVAGTNEISVAIPAYITFGSDKSETINGGDVLAGDHLYGGAGDDTINGDGGNDYLEGGSGRDSLVGGYGDDLLIGMQDNDVLMGGDGNDRLQGGTGFDTYKYTSGEGFDTITDSDGAGEIRYTLRGTEYVLAGGKKVGDNLWESDDHHFTYKYVEASNRLVINGGQIVVFNFHPGDLGISLGNAAPIFVPDTGLEIDGSYQDNRITLGEASANFPPGSVAIAPDGQNITYAPTSAGVMIEGFAGADILDGSKSNDRIYGDRVIAVTDLDQQAATGARGDFINGFEGRDLIYGTAAIDVLYGGGGEDTLYGGPGNDVLWGDSVAYAALPDWYVQSYQNSFAFEIRNTVSIDAWNDMPGFGVDLIYGGPGEDIILAGGGDDIVSGDAGNDVLGGDDGDDLIFGGSGDDLVQGDVPYPHIAGTNIGNDYIDGGDGADRLYGLRGNDTIFGGIGNDFLYGDQAFSNPATPLLAEHGDDYLDGGEGNDELYGDGGDDMIVAGAGADWLSGGQGNDWLDGGDGNDQISGFEGNDVLVGGPGIDGLNGGAGDDTYIIAAADLAAGREVINDPDGTNYLQLNVPEDSVVFSGIRNDALLEFGEERELLIGSGLVGGMSGIQFASGETYDFRLYLREHLATRADIYTTQPNSELGGGPLSDFLRAYAPNVSFFGGTGIDYFYAYAPGATIHLNLGDGSDRLEAEVDPATRASRPWNVIEFGPGITPESLHLVNGGLHSIGVQYGTHGEQIDLVVKANSALLPIDAVRFDDGSMLTWEELVRPGVDVDYSNAGKLVPATQARGGTEVDDRIIGSPYGEYMWGYNGNDVIDGRGGNDILSGGRGNDTYLFGYGDGRDSIWQLERTVGDQDHEVLRFKSDVAPTDVSFVRYENHLIAELRGTFDSIMVSDFFGINAVSMEFADGTTYPSTAVPVTPGPSRATPYADGLYGAPWAEVFDARGGNDIVSAGGGDDTIDGGTGNDTLYGEAGNDALIGGPGRDVLVGGAGDDIYVLSPGHGYGEISDSQGTNSILITGASPEDVHLTRTTMRSLADALVVQIGASADQLWVPGYFAGNIISSIAVAGVIWDQTAIAARIVDIRGAANAMAGTTGNDVFTVDNHNDTITDPSSVDVDVFQTSLSYGAPPANVENLILSGTLDIDGFGNNQRNVLQGNSANNRLYAGGSDWESYSDTLKGGAGDDEYYFTPGLSYWSVLTRSILPVTIVENPNEGIDTFTTDWYYASLPANVENLAVVGVGSYYSIDLGVYSLTDDLRPLFIGNSDGNIIDLSALTVPNQISLINGLGGAIIDGGGGADILIGSDENDFYVVDNPGDVIVERSSVSKADTLVAPFSATVLVNVENIELSGNAAISATGDNGNNRLNGSKNSAANVLFGGLGDDTYVVDMTDVIVEKSGEGSDTVVIDVSEYATGVFSLAPYANVENIRAAKDAGAITLVGNDFDNAIYGSRAGNILRGEGGNDTIADVYSPEYLVHPIGRSYGVPDDADQLYGGAGDDVLQSYSGPDLLDGGTGNDILKGGMGNDTLDGGPGADVVSGGLGDDIFIVDDADDVFAERANEGVDVVQSSIHFELPDNIENLTLTGAASNSGAGNALDNVIMGNSGANTLWGREGNDTINGGAGADTMYGEAGDDILVIDNASDVAIGGPGMDTLQSPNTYTLSDSHDIESLTLIGTRAITGTGNVFDNVLTGNGANNTLYGKAGNDTLIGSGGTDKLYGGTGDDLYIYDGVDSIVENANEGTDTVLSSLSYALSANFENLTLAGTAPINGTGNALANVLTGNGAPNILNGGTGADRMVGGAGDDSYLIDNAGDTVVENVNEGIDTVQTSISYSLASNVENLTLMGNKAITGSGNALDNALTGNGAASELAGGLGNDTYVVKNTANIIRENPNEGTDTIQSSVTYTLRANVENLVLTGTSGIAGTGNELDNLLFGNSGKNALTGGGGNDILVGGRGADTLTGGAGSDTFDYNAINDGIDVITDFTLGPTGDRIDIHDVLVGYVPGVSSIRSFVKLSGTSTTTVAVNADGIGTDFVAIANLNSIVNNTGLLDSVVAQGNLVLA